MKKLITIAFLMTLANVSYGQDFEETKALAEQGNAQAQNNLGFMYDHGEGVPENDAEAVRWWRLAAQQAHPCAFKTLKEIQQSEA